jgi:cbb3-type cytochrome oxidase subunit 1
VIVPRGVVQNIIDWWFVNNTLFVALALFGVGIAFYFIPKLSNRPLANSGLALYAFIGLILFGSWVGIPAGAPVPAWLPVVSQLASAVTLPAILAIALLSYRTAPLGSVSCGGGPFCFFRFGLRMFTLASVLYLSSFCPLIGRVVQFTWYGFGVSQFQLLGFFATIVFGGVYELLPRTSGMALPFPGLVKAHFVLNALGVLLFVVPLIIGGVEQGNVLQNAAAPFSDSSHTALTFLRASTTGQLLLLLGSLLFALNIFVMTIQWKIALVKSIVGYVLSPLKSPEVKA